MRLLNFSESAYPISPLGSKGYMQNKRIHHGFGQSSHPVQVRSNQMIYPPLDSSHTNTQIYHKQVCKTRILMRGIKKCNKPRLDYGMNAPSMSPPMPSVKGLVQAHCRMVKRVHKPKWPYHDLA